MPKITAKIKEAVAETAERTIHLDDSDGSVLWKGFSWKNTKKHLKNSSNFIQNICKAHCTKTSKLNKTVYSPVGQ